jgi:hypothetical protein
MELDHITGTYCIGRDIDRCTVHHNVLVAHELTGSRAGRGDAHPVYYVVKAAFQETDKVLTGCALLTGSLYIRVAELLLEAEVGVLCFLLFLQLNGILGSGLTLFRVTMHTGRVAVLTQVLA